MANKFIISLLLLSSASVTWAGAWGPGSFENDSALDWVNENITAATSLNVISKAFATVQTNKYLDVDDCSSAIAAAEIIASINANKFDNLPDDVANWAKRNKSRLNKTLVNEALKSVKICSESNKSELAQLWSGPQNKEWMSSIDKIKAGLK